MSLSVSIWSSWADGRSRTPDARMDSRATLIFKERVGLPERRTGIRYPSVAPTCLSRPLRGAFVAPPRASGRGDNRDPRGGVKPRGARSAEFFRGSP
jgi:hypothetical protein